MKREFNLSYKQDIIDGKIKVVTDCGEPVEIVKWNCKGNYPILAVIDDGNTSDTCFYDEEGFSPSKKDRIYILTDESTESEVWQIANNAAITFDEATAILKATKDAYDKGRKDVLSRCVSEGHLVDWYIASIDETEPPVWTEEHIEELCRDFYVIPKEK